jgi:hypothetical protein
VTAPTITLETQLQAALLPLCTRVYPDVAPDGTLTPYVVWHELGGQSVQYVDGALANRRNALVQVNVWHESRAVANQLSLDIEAALVAHPTMQAQTQGALQAAYDDDASLRGAMQDFSLWAPR